MEKKRFQPAPRGSGYVYPLLSSKDEFVPDTHLGIYAIYRNPKNKTVYLNEEHCQKLRQKTFDSIMELFRKYGSPDFADLFNYNIETFNILGLNYLTQHPRLRPFSKVVECFEKKGKPLPDFKYTRTVISFGISKKILDYYFSHDRRIPILGRTKEKSRDFILYGADEIQLDDKDSVEVDRTALYRKFEHWCELQSMDKKQAIQMAIKCLLDKHPLPELLPTSEYDYITEFDRPLFAKRKVYNTQKIKKQIEFSSMLYATAEAIVARYNRDPEHINSQVTLDQYMNNAINLLNNNMDLKYRDPELYREQQETKKLIESQKNKSQKGE